MAKTQSSFRLLSVAAAVLLASTTLGIAYAGDAGGSLDQTVQALPGTHASVDPCVAPKVKSPLGY